MQRGGKTVEREMFVRCRRQRDRMRHDLKVLGVSYGTVCGRLGLTEAELKEQRLRYRPLLRIGSLVLMKDAQRPVAVVKA
jgi:hypothetical protein